MAASPSTPENGHLRRPSIPVGFGSAPGKMTVSNGQKLVAKENFLGGFNIVDAEGVFNENLSAYLAHEKIIPAGFNYHLISVFGSQSTGKSTLLNYLFGTTFGVMNEEERRQTTKGIWLSKNKNTSSNASKSASTGNMAMAENILVMDVEGTDGRERGEDQDFERKSALFALATSEILIVNLWETQVGLYHGANMGLLKTVFEVNLQLFIKDNKSIPRSLLFFVLRDHTGRTPLNNLQNTLIADLGRIWGSISKPPGLENSKIQDYFDFAFAALPHKLLQPEKFEADVAKLGLRFREGYKDPKKVGLVDENEQPLLLPEYHRRIPADGFPLYASGVWDQIMSNKDLDLPTQQELLAQFRCDEIARECMIPFDEVVSVLEKEQADSIRAGTPFVIPELGSKMTAARTTLLTAFETAASRYHKGVFKRKQAELEGNVDGRLKILYEGQLAAALKTGVAEFAKAVSDALKGGSKGGQYDFAKIVETEKANALARFQEIAEQSSVAGTSWSEYSAQLELFKKEIDKESKRLRQDEMRLLATRVERWIKSRLGDSIGLEFNKLGSGRGGSGAPEFGKLPTTENDHWDRVWNIFTDIVSQGDKRFVERAKSFDASNDEVEIGLWRLRRKAWATLREKIDEEVAEGNLGMKLRENFEDCFRYDEEGVPRIWRPTDDIDGQFSRARDHTVKLIPLLSRFRLSATSAPPPLDAWVGEPPSSLSRTDEEDLTPIGGVDADADATLEDETLVLSDTRQADILMRFRKMADGVYVEAKRGALGGVTQTPWWMWGLLLVLGQNEIFAVARNPLLIVLFALGIAGLYITYQLNLWGPIIRMTTAAWQQAIQVGQERLREFLLNSEAGRQAAAIAEGQGRGRKAESHNDDLDEDPIRLERLGADGKRSKTGTSSAWEEDDE